METGIKMTAEQFSLLTKKTNGLVQLPTRLNVMISAQTLNITKLVVILLNTLLQRNKSKKQTSYMYIVKQRLLLR